VNMDIWDSHIFPTTRVPAIVGCLGTDDYTYHRDSKHADREALDDCLYRHSLGDFGTTFWKIPRPIISRLLNGKHEETRADI
jgi:hypothetical protein